MSGSSSRSVSARLTIPELRGEIERLPDDAGPDPWGGPRAVSYRIPVSRRTGRRPTGQPTLGRHLPPGLRNRSVPVPRDAERIVGGVGSSGGRDAGGCLQRRPARTGVMLPNQRAARLGGRVASNRRDRVPAGTRGKARGAGASSGRKVPPLPPPLGGPPLGSPSGPDRLHSPVWRDRESAPFRYRAVSVVKGKHAKIAHDDGGIAPSSTSESRSARATCSSSGTASST